MALVTATVSLDSHDQRAVEEMTENLLNEKLKTQPSKKSRSAKTPNKRIIASLTRKGPR